MWASARAIVIAAVVAVAAAGTLGEGPQLPFLPDNYALSIEFTIVNRQSTGFIRH